MPLLYFEKLNKEGIILKISNKYNLLLFAVYDDKYAISKEKSYFF